MTEEGRPVILFVDDDEKIVDSVSRMMSTEPVRLHTAHCGFDALEVLQNGLRPDLLICDYQMPGLNGVEVVEWARAEIGTDTPAVILSIDHRAAVQEHSVLPNCRQLRKPIQPDEFIVAICDSLQELRLALMPQQGAS